MKMTELASVDGVLQDAKELHQLRRFNEAEKLYSIALNHLGQMDSLSSYLKQLLARAYNDRGHCRYMQVYFDEAVEDYSKAIELDPTLAAAYYNRGTIHYRLCAAKSQEAGERHALLQQATEDFEEAVRLASDNQEFQEGLKNCKDMDAEREGDGNVIPRNKKHNVVIQWPNIPYGKLVKLLFLLDNGDKTTGTTDTDRQQNIMAAAKAKEAFLSVLRDETCSFNEVLIELRKRVKELVEYPFIRLPGETEAANLAVRKQDEDLLTLTEACHYLGIECHNLDDKVKKVQEKLFLTDKEMQGSFFIYAENLRINRICDSLTPTLVHELLDITKKDAILNKLIDSDLDVSIEKVKLEGVKEALFFYIIRVLEEHDKLNRVYTGKLEDILERLSKETKNVEEQRKILKLVDSLGDYPSECYPAGHCIVFCVTKDREGAEGEISKVKKVFEDSLGYTVQIVENPTQENLEECRNNLKKQKYRFYDSIVYWFMTHGTEALIMLADDKGCDRKEIIDSFSKLVNFRKKPKIFFMNSCRGESAIAVSQKGGIRVTVDGTAEAFLEIPEQCYNITAVYYQMDRLVANATLPEHFSFRLPEGGGGSLYVDTVCRLLEKHRGKNITEILERVCNKLHQILCSCNEKFQGEAKQACNYETTFQKTFRVPSSS